MILPVRPKQMLSLTTQDGIRLDADVYMPEADGEFPVLLMRQPYGRAIASTVVYAHPIWYAAQGYIVVIQDVRGRGTSEGEFDLFAHEIEDGYETVNWAAALPNSTGQVGMYGFSYQGMTQLYAAAAQPAALKTICPSMIGYDLYHDWAYEGGAFCYLLNLAWALQLAAETARRQGDAIAYQTLYSGARHPPIVDPVCPHSGLLTQLAPDSFYHVWLNHPDPDEYWERLSPKGYLAHVDLPMLHIGGWFDTYLRGTWQFYKEMAGRSAFLQSLIIGPWAHLPWGRKAGGIDYGDAAVSPVDRLQIRWFDQFLKGIDTGVLAEPPVHLFEMGCNHWLKCDRLPLTASHPLFLQSDGLASIDQQSGRLVWRLERPAEQEQQVIPDVLVHDPWRPVPTLGGHAAYPAGAFDRTSLDDRSDVLTYTSAPLPEDVHLLGEIAIALHCTADTPSFDLCAVLSEVKPTGGVINFSQGYVRVKPKATSPIQLTLQATCIRLTKGSCLRLSLSGACFPAYAVNSGSGVTANQAELIQAQVITIQVYPQGKQGRSTVLLPVMESDRLV
jgi:hypothetical protein